MTTRVSLPGMRSPGAGFDQPFEMLDACHDRVRRSLDLLRRLRDYLRGHGHGCDDSARQAARDVLRYFDIAAPLHHEDEEMHVFPPLLDNGTPEVRAAVQQLQDDHQAMHTHWQAARERLQAMAQGQTDAFTPDDEALFERFASGYGAHIRTEEDLVYPAARALLAPATLQAMGAEMRRRRGAAG